MSLKNWARHPVKSFRGWQLTRRLKNDVAQIRKNLPLREFVYLDAVSLHSLLVSQTDTIPEAITQTISRADEAELIGSASASAGNDLIGKAEAKTNARYQTSNSDSTQSSRKAVIQTLFKQLREQPLNFKLSPPDHVDAFEEASDIKDTAENVAAAASSFVRGDLVEVEVVLAVDPVFKLGAMMNEWSAMADEYPAMFSSTGTLGFLRESEPIMKVLDRFLTGLIPIRATAVNYVVAIIDGTEYVLHKNAVATLELETQPLFVTGVTEHLGFWKDIRRVLFSDARFTILSRVATDGLHDKWTPVKLADLFSEVAPDFVDQINAIRSPTAESDKPVTAQVQNLALAKALTHYRLAIAPNDAVWSSEHQQEFTALATQLSAGATDAIAQREAFDLVREQIITQLGTEAPSPDVDLKARQDARSKADLELLPQGQSLVAPARAPSPSAAEEPESPGRIIDTEVIAIYW
ncbi:hypothetical protein SAMN04489751_3443 [Brevibacterium sandarakinum]|uniref:Uncharacterized protein n=1 Tax=Brevibacterium sandarakinum TaxID=629680 RepID=A0A1H1WPX1_BRESA|nr:hypothetical protein [Brevibacterium sandarakinum]SDS99124.1 hypothetical protein SAMN04489751_3443 [Brevibacterium sandarakinum]